MTQFPLDPLGRMLVPAASINTLGRLRQVYNQIEELAEDIKTNGLIQPVVITEDLRLVAGGRRFKAMTEVLKLEHIPCVYKDADDNSSLRVQEIMENVAREDLTWQERILGIVEVHELTTQEKTLAREKWTRQQTADLMKVSRGSINNAIWLVECIRAGDQDIIKAAGVREAMDILMKRAEDAATKKLALMHTSGKGQGRIKVVPVKPLGTTVISNGLTEEEGFVRAPSAVKDYSELTVQATADEDPDAGQPEHVIPLSRMFFNQDCVDFGMSLPAGYCDHIITDIPYGIDMDHLPEKSVEEVRAEHDVDANIALYHRMMPMFAHVLKDKGFVVMWYDLDHHQLLKDLAIKFGFAVQRWPLTWHKLHQCKNDAAMQNWTKTTEVAMVLRKGNATLVTPQNTCCFALNGEQITKRLGHPFAKPIELWRWVYSATCIIGQTVFDPFVGAGSSALAAVEHGLRPIGCESNEVLYNKCIVNVSEKYKQVIGNVRFE